MLAHACFASTSLGADPGCGASADTGQLQKAGQERATAPAKTPADPNAKPQWVCEAPIVTLEPIWTGKKMNPSWDIRNTGTADLNIKLRGG
jgi:hypothetical protein